MSFAAFLQAFTVTLRSRVSSWAGPHQAGWSELMLDYGGSTFDSGLYRLHTPETSTRANEAVTAAHPELEGRLVCFGYDWLGRQFGIDSDAPVPESVRMIEPGTGEVLEIPASFAEFHNTELVAYRDAALASSFFEGWSRSNPASLPILPDQCVGYRVPLFLGGTDDLANLELTDLSVYLDVSAQLFAQVAGLPPGTSVSTIRIE